MPKRISDPAKRRVEMMGFYDTVSTKEAIAAAAAQLNITMAEFMRRAVNKELKRMNPR